MTISIDESLQAKHNNFWKSFSAFHYVFFFLKVRHAILFFLTCEGQLKLAKMSFLIS